MSVTVEFGYHDYRDLDLDEAPCVAPDGGNWATFTELVAENEDDMGCVVIRQDDTPEVRVEDSLLATIPNLLAAVPDLVDGHHVVIPYFQTYGYLRMDPEASDQLISGDYVPTVRIKRAGLLPGIVALGERFTEFLERLVEARPDYAAIIEDLRDTRLPAAHEAVARWNGT